MARGWQDIVIATAVGDWDGRLFGDVIALDSNGRLWLYPTDGYGGFDPRVLLSAASSWAGRTSLVGGGDFNGDGVLDLVSVTETGALVLNSRSSTGGILPATRLDSGWTNELLG